MKLFGREGDVFCPREVIVQLQADDPNLDCLRIELSTNNCDDAITSSDQIIEIGRAIGRSTSLDELTIDGWEVKEGQFNLAVQELELLSSGGLGLNTSTRFLDIKRCGALGGKVIETLIPLIENNPNLESIDVIKGMTSHQFGLLGAALVRREVCLHGLILSECMDMCDENLELFLSEFEGAPNRLPKIISFGGNNVGLDAIRKISKLLEEPTCSAEKLYLPQADDTAAADLAKGLVRNRSVTSLSLSHQSVTLTGWNAFIPTLYNTDSIDATYQSNHTLKCLGKFPDRNNPLPATLQQSLELNQNPNKQFVACQKVLANYFSEDNILDTLKSMESHLLVHVPAFFDKAIASGAAMAEDRDLLYFSYFYNMVKSKPLLCKRD